MDKINQELQNLRSRHDQLLSQIDESQNQDTVMELKFLIEEKISAIQLLITPNPKQKCAKIYPENALHYINEFPVVFIFTQKMRHLTELPWNFGVLWGRDHRLNMVRTSFIPPSIKASALLLAMLTATHQACKMGFKVLNIVSADSLIISNILNSIPTMRERGYAKNEEDFPSEPLERLDRLMVENKIMIHAKNQACSPTILSVYEQLLECFKNTLKGPEARK